MPSIQKPPTNQSSNHKAKLVINWEKLTIISSGVLFIIIILVLVYWFFALRPQVESQVSRQTEESFENVENPESTEISQLTKNWRSVSDTNLGIEFKHPPNWSVEVNEEPSIYFFMENKDDWDLENYTEIVLESPDYTSDKVADGGEKIKKGSRILVTPYKNEVSFNTLDEVSSNEIGSRDFERKIIIDGQVARRIDYTQDTAFYFTEVYVLKNGRAFLIIRSYLEGERSIYEEIFNAVVRSLKFTK